MALKTIGKSLQKFISWPSLIRRRDTEMRDLLIKNDNKITSHDIFNIEFGKGFLEKNGAQNIPNLDLSIKNFFQDDSAGLISKITSSVGAAGYVQTHRPDNKNEQEIFMNRLMFSYPAQVGLVTALPGIGKALLAAISTPTKYLYFKLSLLSTSRYAFVPSVLQFPIRSVSDVIGHEHIHVLQRETKTDHYHTFNNFFQKNIGKEPSQTISTLKFFDHLASVGSSKYYRNDAEVQARLHTVVAMGTKRWGKLPQNRSELFAALSEAGVKMPKTLREEFQDQMENDIEFYSAFSRRNEVKRFLRQASTPEIGGLNSATAAWIEKSAKYDFWNVAVPYMYGHLLELYGIEDGRKKMGFEIKNPHWALNPIS